MSASTTLLKIHEKVNELAKRKARKSLLAFTKFTFPIYRANWHHKSYASILDKFIEGKIKRLMVFMPPQHGKSELCSRRMPAKLLGDNPNLRIAVIAYNHTFAAKFNRDIQRIIDSKEYHELYPETTLNSQRVRAEYRAGNKISSRAWLRNSDEFEVVNKRGSLISTGIGGSLTGNKVDVAIVDDPYKDAMEANSEAFRNRLEEWWDAVLETRLHNESRICLTFTRWRHDDIAGKLLEIQKEGVTTDKWTIVRYQALKDDSAHETPLDDPRKQGEALWPDQHSTEKLNNVRSKNAFLFEALYQQNPTLREGNVIKESYFSRYRISELPKGLNHCYIDTATSEEELKNNDPTGILVYRIYRNHLYLVDFVKGRWSQPDLIEKIKQVHSRHLSGRNSRIWIENKSNGRSTKQILQQETKFSVLLENIKGKKMERVENELPTLEAGRVLLPEGEIWVDDFLAHLKGFPLMEHDEEVDCLTGAIRTGLGSAEGGLPQFL